MASSTNRVNSFIIIVGFLKIVFHFVLPRRIIFKRKCYLDVTSQAIGLPFPLDEVPYGLSLKQGTGNGIGTKYENALDSSCHLHIICAF